MERIEQGFMAFLDEGGEGVGAVQELSDQNVIIYVENAGSFTIPLDAVKTVHDDKVILSRERLSRVFLLAVEHQHDSEDRTAG